MSVWLQGMAELPRFLHHSENELFARLGSSGVFWEQRHWTLYVAAIPFAPNPWVPIDLGQEIMIRNPVLQEGCTWSGIQENYGKWQRIVCVGCSSPKYGWLERFGQEHLEDQWTNRLFLRRSGRKQRIHMIFRGTASPTSGCKFGSPTPAGLDLIQLAFGPKKLGILKNGYSRVNSTMIASCIIQTFQKA